MMRLREYLQLLTLLVILIPAQPAQTGTSWTCDEFTGVNCGEAINDVFMVTPGEAWAVGDFGILLHKDAGVWEKVPSPTTENLNRLRLTASAQGSPVGWAVGDGGSILDFVGADWSLAPFLGDVPNVDLYDIDLVDADNGWAVGYNVWAGSSAILVLREGVWEDYTASLNFNAVEMLSETDGWAVGEGGRILHYDGLGWQRVPSPVEVDLFALDMISAAEGWAVGETGYILHYANGSWSVQDNSDTVNYYGISMNSDSEGWAVGSVGHYMHYQNGKWTRTLEELAFSRAVDMVNPTDGWAVSEKGGLNGWIYHYDGLTWALDSTPSDSLFTLKMISADEGWAMGGTNSPFVLYYDGVSWAEVPYSGGGGTVYTMDMLSLSEGWAAGDAGLLMHYQSGTWTQVTGPTDAALRGLDMVSASEGWAVGDGVILHYSGGSWDVYADTTPPVDEELFALDVIDTDDAWAVGDAGVILHWDGAAWDLTPSPIYVPGSSRNEIRDVSMDDAGSGWATGTAVLGDVITPVLLRYSGVQWELSFTGGGGDFVHMLSPMEGWFGLEWYGDDCFILHFQDQDGVIEVSDFSPVYTPRCIADVDFLTPGEGMAVVGAVTTPERYDHILYYHDGKWFDEQITRHFNLQDVDASGATEAWAVGSKLESLGTYHGEKSAILHYSDGKWRDYSKDPPLFDLDMASNLDGWAVGGDERQGVIYHYDGLSWTQTQTTTYRLNAVHMLNANEGWAVGYNGATLHLSGTQAGGSASWSTVQSPTSRELYDVFVAASDDVWAVGAWGTILHYNGLEWIEYESPSTRDIYTIEMLSSTEGWAFGSSPALHYLNGVWTAESSPGLFYDVDLLSAGDGWAAGWNNIQHYDGQAWVEVPLQFSKRWLGIDMTSADDGWVVGEDGFILRYNSGNWQIAGGPTGGTLQAVEMLSVDEGWALGNGTILHYVDGSWQAVIANRPTEKILFAVDMTPDGSEGWAVGQDGVMLRYRSGVWEKVISATTNNLSAVHMLSASDGWAVGAGGTILKYNGANWQYSAAPVVNNLIDVFIHSPSDAWAVGEDVILHYDGADWSTVPCQSSFCGGQSISMSSPDSGWIGSGSVFLTFANGSWQWDGNYTNMTANAVEAFNPDYAWAVGDGANSQTIAVYDGSTWKYFPSPTDRILYGLAFPTSERGWSVGENIILDYIAPDYSIPLFLPSLFKSY